MDQTVIAFSSPARSRPWIAVVGAGPAGLMAAETLASAGARVTLYERMPSPGRKLLMAGRGGLNLTHGEPFDTVVARYGEAETSLTAALAAFPPDAVRAWAEGLGQETFVGSSGRVFPRAWKASPLLRAWLRRLDGLGVELALRQLWTGLSADGALSFEGTDGDAVAIRPDAAILAMGGASWPRLGSDGGWVEALAEIGIAARPLRPANAGLLVAWSDVFRERFAGTPLKRIALSFGAHRIRGEAIVTASGLEGGAVYGLFAAVRDAWHATGSASLLVDLRPDLAEAELAALLARPQGKATASTHLRKAAGLAPAAIGLLREAAGVRLPSDPAALAALIKATPLAIIGTAGLERAISSAGGIPFAALDDALMLQRRPGLFAAGEMLDWEAPTGGYLLQACFATGAAAARGALAWTGAGGSLSCAGSACPPRNP